jgi:hypothetical protein
MMSPVVCELHIGAVRLLVIKGQARTEFRKLTAEPDSAQADTAAVISRPCNKQNQVGA